MVVLFSQMICGARALRCLWRRRTVAVVGEVMVKVMAVRILRRVMLKVTRIMRGGRMKQLLQTAEAVRNGVTVVLVR